MDEARPPTPRSERLPPAGRPIPAGGVAPPPYEVDRQVLERVCFLEPTRGSGPGGQRRNKVETGVRLVHPPSGVVIVATRRASRLANVEDAFERLSRRLQALNHVPKRRRATRPSRAAKESRLDSKKRQAEKKAGRRPPSDP
jgi:ribosome-associated protein